MVIGTCDECGVSGILVYKFKGEPTLCFPCYTAKQREDREKKLKAKYG